MQIQDVNISFVMLFEREKGKGGKNNSILVDPPEFSYFQIVNFKSVVLNIQV